MGHYSHRKAEGHGSTGAENRVILRHPDGNVTLKAVKDGSGDVHLNTLINGTETKIINLTAVGGGASPVGSMMQFAGDTPPDGWLLANGATVSKIGTYAALFDVVGYKFDTSLSDDNFKLPDMREKFPVGANGTPGDMFESVGNDGDATLRDAFLPNHTHTSTRPLTGLVDHPTGSTTVTGTGTEFVSECAVGHQIRIGTAGGENGDGWFEIESITSNTQLTTTTNGTGEDDVTAYCWPRTEPTVVSLTGTLSSASDATITGTGTSFLTEIHNGWEINFEGTPDWYEVDHVTSDTELTLSSSVETGDRAPVDGKKIRRKQRGWAQNNYEGTTGTGNFTERHDFYSELWPKDGHDYTKPDGTNLKVPPGLQAEGMWQGHYLNTASIGQVSKGASFLGSSSDYYDADSDDWTAIQWANTTGHTSSGAGSGWQPFDIDEFCGGEYGYFYGRSASGALSNLGATWTYSTDTYDAFSQTTTLSGHHHYIGGQHGLSDSFFTEPSRLRSPYFCPEFKGTSFFYDTSPFDDGTICNSNQPKTKNSTPVYGTVLSEVDSDNYSGVNNAGGVEMRDAGTVSPTGDGDGTDGNIPPFLTLNYIIKY